MEEVQIGFRRWDELIPEILGLIFSLLYLEELLTVVPCVCNSWRNVVIAPYCWQRIDITQWINGLYHPLVDRMLRMLITRSGGSLRELCVLNLESNALFTFITENAGSLQVLRISGSLISDSIVEQTSQRFSKITLLDLSNCFYISASGLEVIGKHCKLLVTLCRNMFYVDEVLLDILGSDCSVNTSYTYDEADAIASTMTGLKHLEMRGHVITIRSALNLLSRCTQLEYLDITGCIGGKLEEGFLKEKFPKLEARGLNVRRL